MILLAGFLILVSAQNIQEVTIKLFVWERQIPLIFLIYLTFFGGFLFGLLYSKISFAFIKLKEKHKQFKNKRKEFKEQRKEKPAAE